MGTKYFGNERGTQQREKLNGLNLLGYFLAKIVADLPKGQCTTKQRYLLCSLC
jgi:hypothetical protein